MAMTMMATTLLDVWHWEHVSTSAVDSFNTKLTVSFSASAFLDVYLYKSGIPEKQNDIK